MAVRKWLVHFIAKCDVCKWQTEDYLAGPRRAAEHSRKTGHTVSAELGYAAKYRVAKDR